MWVGVVGVELGRGGGIVVVFIMLVVEDVVWFVDLEIGVEVILIKYEIIWFRFLILLVLYVEEIESSLFGVSSNIGCYEIGEDYLDVRVIFIWLLKLLKIY